MPGEPSYPVEVLHDGWRICASDADDALELIAGGYADLKPGPAQMQARIAVALEAKRAVQALLNAGEVFEQNTWEQQKILMGPPDSPPKLNTWAGVTPLVLVASFYRPLGDLDESTVAGAGQIWWIDPHTPGSLLETLHQVRWLDVTRMRPVPSTPRSSYRNLGPNGSAGYWWRPLKEVAA